MLSPLWSVNLFIQVWKFIFIKLPWIDLISINLTISPVILIGIISSIIFSSPGKIPIISINSQARCYRLRINKVAMGVACVLEFPFQRKDIIREKNKEAWYYFFKYWIIFSAGSLCLLCEKYTVVILWPPRKVSALHVVRTWFLAVPDLVFTPLPLGSYSLM